MKTAVIYARYSCDNQSEQSIEGQLHVCQEYAQRNNILILDTYIDRAMSGTNDNRPDFQRMLKDSGRREWDYVLVYKLDRFSRNKYETAIHKKTLRDNGVKVLSAMENIPDTPEGIILESLLEGMNQYYSAELAQKVSRGMKETRKKGLYQGGTLLYGYMLDGRKIVINQSEAEVVRYIYSEYSRGVYVRDIIKALDAQGITYKGKKFVKNSVYNILRNEKYSGVYKHGDEVVDNMYPQIVPPELFEKVRAIVNKNKYGKRSLKADFLLLYKLKCGYCGQPINAESGTTRNGTRIYYYKCSSRKKKSGSCRKTMIRKEVLEELVLNEVIAQLKSPETMNYIICNLLKLQEEQTSANSVLNLLLKEQKQVQISIDNIVNAIERGVVSKATAKRLKELEERQQELEVLIIKEQNKTCIQLSEQNMREFYETALRYEPKMLINYLVKQIVLYDDKMEIYFNNPIINGGPDYESRGFCFYMNTVTICTYLYAKTSPALQKIKIEMFIG